MTSVKSDHHYSPVQHARAPTKKITNGLEENREQRKEAQPTGTTFSTPCSSIAMQ
jgi:hypothetical protein